MAGVRQQRAAETRQRIVDAARRLFAEKGYYATGTAEIVAAAGVGTRGALYHHFADKAELFRAVFEAVEADLGANSGSVPSGRSGFERLSRALHGFLDASVDPEVRRIILIDGPAVLGWETWREIEARHGLGAIEHLLAAGVADGSATATDPGALAHLLLSAVDEAALFIAHAEDTDRARARAGEALAILLGGVAARPSGAPDPGS